MMNMLKKGQKQVTALILAFICVFSLVGALLPSGVVKANENIEIPIYKTINNLQSAVSFTEIATGQYNMGSVSLVNNELPQMVNVPESPHDGWVFVGMKLYYIENYYYSSEENDCYCYRYNLNDKGYVYDENGNYINGSFNPAEEYYNGSYYIEENGQKFFRVILVPHYKIEDPFNLYLVGLDNNMQTKNEGEGVLSAGDAEIYPTDVFIGPDMPGGVGGVEGNYNLFMYYLNYAEITGGLEAVQEYATDLPENIKPVVAVFNLGGGSWLAGGSSDGTLWSNGWQYGNNNISAIDTGIDTTLILQDIENQKENLNPLVEQLGAQIEAGEITEDEALAQYNIQYNQIVDSHKEELKEMINSLPELGYDLTVPIPEGYYINDLSKVLNIISGYYGGNNNLMYIDKGGLLHDTTYAGNKVSYNSDVTFDYTINNDNTITIKVRPLAVIDPTTNHIVLMYNHVYTPGILICFKPNVVNINLEDAYFANENLDNNDTYVLEGAINRSEKKLTYKSDDDNQNPVIQKNKAIYNEQEDKWEDYVLTGFYDENGVKYFDSDFNAVKEWDEETETYTLYAKYEKNEPINQAPDTDNDEDNPANPDNETIVPPIIVPPVTPIIPTPDFEPEPNVKVKAIKEIAPVITRENGKYVVKAEENANYTVSDVIDSKVEPYFDGENINIFDETLLTSKMIKLAENDFNKYLVLSLKANEGYEFDDELTINLPEEYETINVNIKGDNAVIIMKYNDYVAEEEKTPENEDVNIDEIENTDIVDDNGVFNEGVNKELEEGSNLGNKANETNYTDGFTDNALTAQNEEYTSSQTVVNESKVVDVPKTDDNVVALLIVISVMVLVAGTGTVILCKRYC